MLFREVQSTPGNVLLRYPSRFDAFFHFLWIGGAYSALLLFARLAAKPSDYIPLAVGAVLLALPGIRAVSRLWEQRALHIDIASRSLTYLRRVPFRTEKVCFDVGDMDCLVLTTSRRPHGSNPRNELDLWIYTATGQWVFLGTAVRETAKAQASRFSNLLGLPLHIPEGA